MSSGEEQYRPLAFSVDCNLDEFERECIENQRKDLWKHGIRKQPMLDRMAFEFGYVLCLLKQAAGGHGADGDSDFELSGSPEPGARSPEPSVG